MSARQKGKRMEGGAFLRERPEYAKTGSRKITSGNKIDGT